ncbi:MAG: SDR family NAD(P)-dependent oxidoreductase [Thiolinea sp.]
MAQAPRCILITGASAGLGAALARAYAGPDMTLGLIARNNERLLAVAESCRQRGAQVVTMSLDVTDTEALQTWIKNFDHAHPIDLLIANAGITSQLGPQGQAEPLECIHRVLDTDLRGCIDSVDAVPHAMRQRGHGQIALVSSLAALHGMPVTPAYCAAKTGVKAYGVCQVWLAGTGRHSRQCHLPRLCRIRNEPPILRPQTIHDQRRTRGPTDPARPVAQPCLHLVPFPVESGHVAAIGATVSAGLVFLGLSGYNRLR